MKNPWKIIREKIAEIKKIVWKKIAETTEGKSVKGEGKEKKKGFWKVFPYITGIALVLIVVLVMFGIQWEIMLLIGLSIVLVLLMSYVLLFILAKSDLFFTLPGQDEIIFIMVGENVKKVILVSDEYYTNKLDGWKIEKRNKEGKKDNEKEKGEELKNWLNKTFGVYWIGLPPYSSVLTYKFAWTKAINKKLAEAITKEEDGEKGIAGIEDVPFADIALLHREEIVKSLYLYYLYAVSIKGVELVGNITIDILLYVVTRAYDPIKSVITLKGNWFPALVGTIHGACADIAREFNFAGFQRLEKGKKEVKNKDRESGKEKEDEKEKTIRKKTKNKNKKKEKEDKEDLLGKAVGDTEMDFSKKIKDRVAEEAKEATGMCIDGIIYVAFGASERSEEIIKALTAKEVKRLTGEGVVIEAKKQGDARREFGYSERDRIKEVFGELDKHPNGANVYMAELMPKGIENYKGEFLSIGGQPPLISIPAKNKDETDKKKRGEK